METPVGQDPQRPETHDEFLRRDANERLARLESGEITRVQYIEENVGLRKRLESLADHDALTDLFNRRGFIGALEKTIKLEKSHGHPVSFGLIDIDHFKKFNDDNGHDAGDQALKKVAEALKRLGGDVGRWGGEELVIALPDVGPDNLVDAVSIIGRTIRQQTAVTVSIGAVTLGDNEEIPRLIKRADLLTYKAKKDNPNKTPGRNRGFVDVGQTDPVEVLFG